MKLGDWMLLGLFGAAAYAASRPRAARPTPAQLFRAEMDRPDPPARPGPRDPVYGVVRRPVSYHAPYGLN